MIVLMILDHFWLALCVRWWSESLFDMIMLYFKVPYSAEILKPPPGYASPEYLRVPPLSESEYARLSSSLHPLGIT